MRTVALPCGERVPAIGLGTWNVGDDARRRADEIAALRLGLDLGAALIDTAEMYGEGRSETLIGEAIAGRRDDVFLVSKVYPHNASIDGAIAACERSLERLRTDRLDLYLLHWRGSVPLEETLAAFERLRQSGKIRHYGVSNLDRADMEELWSVPGGREAQTDQVLYNLTRRGIEWDLLPALRERRIPVMAYSPVEQGRLLANRKLVAFAKRYDMTPAQAALAWVLKDDDVIAIPKTSHPDRVTENVAAADIRLTAEQLAELDAIFPTPQGPGPLEML
jgi:diketogulonate reductase-like aldo/keto reductase